MEGKEEGVLYVTEVDNPPLLRQQRVQQEELLGGCSREKIDN
jgi:hypothetical protein